ncbi:DNA-(apurinic or apyrimidinic site) lyase 2 [Blattella germanica]|nr:DNA-(apurinic or apyrimidinic site) lyase 2 [Blattella germanica]
MSASTLEVHTLKILTWNINGIRSVFKNSKEIKQGLDALEADVICLQETRVPRCALEEEIAIVEGYNSYYGYPRSKTGFSGVATYCKERFTPFQAEEGLSGLFGSANATDGIGCYGSIKSEFSKTELRDLEYEGRAVITLHKIKVADGPIWKSLALINVYCPRADPQNAQRGFMKLRYYHLLEARANALMKEGHLVVVVGDVNTCHKPIDHCNPENVEDFNKNPCRRWLDQVIFDPSRDDDNSNGNPLRLIDAFRFVNPNVENAFTCWSTVGNARSNNYGTRIDYILLDTTLGCALDNCLILKNVEGSDHCPVKAMLDLKFEGSSKCPSLCTKYYPEFIGSQSKLLNFFNKKEIKDLNEEKCKVTISSKQAKAKSLRQRNIKSFFQRPITNCDANSNRSGGSASSLNSSSESSYEYGATKQGNGIRGLNGQESSEAWRMLLAGPKPPPNCRHDEACVLRTVKKKGKNMNRKFWCCARGEGRSGDPNARCAFFQWNK